MSKELAIKGPEDDLISLWHSSLNLSVSAGDISKASGETYRRGLVKFLDYLHSEKIDLVTPEVIQTWKAALLETGNKPGSVNTWYAGVRRFYAWATSTGIVSVNPTSGVKGVKRKGVGKRHLREAFTDREVLRVLAQPDQNTDQGKRDYAMLCLMAFCALREVELQRADLSDLSTVESKTVLRLQGKGSTEKDELAVIFHPKAQDALYDWLAVRGNKPGPLFPSLSNRTKGNRLEMRSIRGLITYVRKAGILDERKTLHSLRHSAISKIARVNVLKARQVARHTSLDTTMIYVHENDRLENPGEQFIDYVNGNNGK